MNNLFNYARSLPAPFDTLANKKVSVHSKYSTATEAKVEDDFMEMAPTDPKDVVRFVKEVPYWTAKKHGKKYRLMYQIYTHPKYIEHGKKFFEGVNERYTEYAKRLEPKIGIPYTVITPLIFIFVRACVHYAMFEDEYYLQTQMEVLKQGVALFVDKYKANQA